MDALEASETLFDYVFARWPLERIVGETLVDNAAARGLAKQLGFVATQERAPDQRIGDRWWPGILMRLHRSDYFSRKKDTESSNS